MFSPIGEGNTATSTHFLANLGLHTVCHVIHRHQLPVESNNKDESVCDACRQGKSHQLPFSLSNRVVTAPLEIVFSDVWGPAQTSVSGHNYYVTFIDAYSRFTGFIFLSARRMCSTFFSNSKLMLNVYLIIKSFMFNQTGG